MTRFLSRGFALVLASFALFTGCREPSPADPARPGQSPTGPRARLVVFAAASLKEAFGALAEPYRAAHPGAEVVFNFAGTQELRAQIEQGAPVDVLASASRADMDALRAAGRVEPPRIFAHNALVLVLASGPGAAAIRGLADLGAPGFGGRVVVGASEVPVGRYTAQALDKATAALGAEFRARFEARIVSRELNVRQVLAKVDLGEADAGIVYRSDARAPVAAGKPPREVRPLEPAWNVTADYPIAVVVGAPDPSGAADFTALVLGPAGRAALEAAGFATP